MKNSLIAVAIAALVCLGIYVAALFLPTPTAARDNTPPPQNSGSQAKINIDAVCQGALAYMTFPDGAAAEKFVAECKEGKHPEVIDKYKADMNLGAGAAI